MLNADVKNTIFLQEKLLLLDAFGKYKQIRTQNKNIIETSWKTKMEAHGGIK